MAPPLLVTLVTDRRQQPELPALAAVAVAAGIDRIQVREKDLPDRELYDLVAAVVKAAGGQRVLVNSRPDVAAAAGALGVQLPEAGLSLGAVRRAFPRLLLGASRHGLEGALEAEAAGADFVVLGPVFPTPGKEQRALGLARFAEVARRLTIPVHAVGGLGPGHAADLRAAGAAGLLAIRAFSAQPLASVVAALRA